VPSLCGSPAALRCAWALGDKVWRLAVIVAVSAFLGLTVVAMRSEYCAFRPAMMMNTIEAQLQSDAPRTPQFWSSRYLSVRQVTAKLAGPAACLATTDPDSVSRLCPDGFKLIASEKIESSVCTVSNSRQFTVVVSFSNFGRINNLDWYW
jgi:hypothetical protein